jgi:hypothetical protein
MRPADPAGPPVPVEEIPEVSPKTAQQTREQLQQQLQQADGSAAAPATLGSIQASPPKQITPDSILQTAPEEVVKSAAVDAIVASPEQAKHVEQVAVIEGGKYHLTMIVIGKVTDSTARILVEVLESGEVEVQLKCVQRNVRKKHTNVDGTSNTVMPNVIASSLLDGRTVIGVRNTLIGGKPRIYKFEGLEPDARYEVSIVDLAHLQPASQFRTLLHDWKISPDYPAMRFAAVSCNLLSETLNLKGEQVDLWADLAQRIQRDEVDCLLHMGDQVYADEFRSETEPGDHGHGITPAVSAYAPATHNAEGVGLVPIPKEEQLVFRRALKHLENVPASERSKHRDTVEGYYRDLYRETWSHKPTAVVLSNVPNMTILDDHDIVDNWGQLPHGRDKDHSSVDFFVATCARQVYWEYQGVLTQDADLTRVEQIEADHHFHTFGEYGVCFTESRGAGSFRYKPEDKTPFLGERQWKDLEQAFAPDGVFQNVKHLLLICPCPVVYLPHYLNHMSEPFCEDALGHWACKPHINEQTRMLNMALAWQEGPGFGDRLKDMEAPPQPTVDAVNRDSTEQKGVHRSLFPSISGLPPQDAIEVGEARVREEKREERDERKVPNMDGPKSALTASPCLSDRRVTFLGGDVHVGGHTRFFKHGHLVMEQLVSSAISNHVIPSLAFAIGSAVQNTYTQLHDGWSFQHQGFTRLRNYGMVDTLRPTDMSAKAGRHKPVVETCIVSAD